MGFSFLSGLASLAFPLLFTINIFIVKTYMQLLIERHKHADTLAPPEVMPEWPADSGNRKVWGEEVEEDIHVCV